MTELPTTQQRRAPVTPTGGGLGFVGILGFLGAVVYFWGSTSSVGDAVLAILKAVVWPAFLVYGALRATLG